MSILNGIIAGVDAVYKQKISNDAFNAGQSGEPPRVIFGDDRYKDVYNESYKRGQEAAQAKLASTINKKLEEH